MLAARNGHNNVYILLIKNGADTAVQNKSGQTAVELRLQHNGNDPSGKNIYDMK
jgi:ankyrin repeat protein